MPVQYVQFTSLGGALSDHIHRNYYPTHSLPVLTTSPLYWNSILSGRVLGLVMHGYLGISLCTPQVPLTLNATNGQRKCTL